MRRDAVDWQYAAGAGCPRPSIGIRLRGRSDRIILLHMLPEPRVQPEVAGRVRYGLALTCVATRADSLT
jgi:hypothetical protein